MGDHTPGPWEARASRFFNVPDSQQYLIVATEKETICRMTASNGPDGRELAMPDARLIAAAPDLLEALEETWRIIESAGIGNLANGVQLGPTAWLIKCCDARDLSKSAIAKAKGGA